MRTSNRNQVTDLVQDHFWGDVLRGSAERPRFLSVLDGLCKSEIDDLHVAPRIQQQVLRLKFRKFECHYLTSIAQW